MNNSTTTLIQEHPVYKQILKDSFGGVCYMKSREDYDEEGRLEIEALWSSMRDSEQEACNGALKGAINFIQGAF